MIEQMTVFVRREEGLTIVEYAVAAGLIAAAVAAALLALGGAIEGVITAIVGHLSAAP